MFWSPLTTCYKEQAIIQPLPRDYRGNYSEIREFILKETDCFILSKDMELVVPNHWNQTVVWFQRFGTRELDVKWSYFKNIIIDLSATDKYVPKSKPGTYNQNS